MGDERIINLQRTKVYVFSDSVLCLGRIHENTGNEAWKKKTGWIISSQSYRDYDGIIGEPTEFEWNIFPGFDTLQLCGDQEKNQKFSQEKSCLCLCSMTFPVKRKTMKENVWHMLKSYLCVQGKDAVGIR